MEGILGILVGILQFVIDVISGPFNAIVGPLGARELEFSVARLFGLE